MKILAINPGSTSTKIAVFEDTKEIMTQNIKHTTEELKDFSIFLSSSISERVS